MSPYPLRQVDVFGRGPLRGNPVAVVHEATDLDDETMQRFARWTNLSETTFLLPATDPAADYRVRIFTPAVELPFAGHPTLGSAHAWLEAGGQPRQAGRVVQQCGVGLVEVRHGDVPAFAAPALLRSGPVDAATLSRTLSALGLEHDEVLRSAWVDNGPGWLGLQLRSAARVLDLRPDPSRMHGLEVGVIGEHTDAEAAGLGARWEVRAFCSGLAVPEDPVTGSLNAGLALWLVPLGVLPTAYVVRQGTALGRDGRVVVDVDADGTTWVGGATSTVAQGSVAL